MKTPWLPASATIRDASAMPAGSSRCAVLRWLWADHAELARQAEMLHADVGLGADGRDAGDGRAGIVCALEIGLGADAGQDRDRDLRALRPRRPPRRAARRRSAGAGRTGSSSRPARRRARRRSPTRPRGRARARRSRPGRRGSWCAIACEPSRSVVSTIRTAGPVLTRAASAYSSATRTAADGHDVEVAGVGGKVVTCALDLEHHRDDAVGDQRGGGQAVAGHVGGDVRHRCGDRALDRLAIGIVDLADRSCSASSRAGRPGSG